MSYLGRLNSLLTSTTSRYDSLRRNILSSSSEDDSNLTDPSLSHVSRVLRAYYTEKSLPFPTWLGPDPRSTPPASSSNPSQQPYAAARPVGSLRGVSAGGGGRGGLGDIWSDGGGGGEEHGRTSLRRGPLGGGRKILGDQQQTQTQSAAEGLNIRPLPSQRAGSYQGFSSSQQGQGGRTGSPAPPPPPPGSSGSASGVGGAAERLKARLGRGGSAGGEGGGQVGGDGGRGGQGRRY